jgi:hypothetical protein
MRQEHMLTLKKIPITFLIKKTKNPESLVNDTIFLLTSKEHTYIGTTTNK